jgi:hypothetical protein
MLQRRGAEISDSQMSKYSEERTLHEEVRNIESAVRGWWKKSGVTSEVLLLPLRVHSEVFFQFEIVVRDGFECQSTADQILLDAFVFVLQPEE